MMAQRKHYEFLVNSASGRLLRALENRDKRDKSYRKEEDPQISHLLREQARSWNRIAARASRDIDDHLDSLEADNELEDED